MKITPLLLLADNYSYLIEDTESNTVAIVDPSEAAPVINYLEDQQLHLDYIINTHHHWDHIGGNDLLQKKYNAKVVAPIYDTHRIANVDFPLADNDTFKIGSISFTALHVPGHTSGQLALWFKEDQALFTGDTVFSLGCGRLFEGTAEQMLNSFQRIRKLPKDTKIYFGHEYTADNLKFALTIEPNNEKLVSRPEPTTPTLLSDEIEQNPFFRWDSEAIKSHLQMPEASDVEVFAKIRRLKDDF